MQQQLVEASLIEVPPFSVHSLNDRTLHFDYVPLDAELVSLKAGLEDDMAFVKRCQEELAILQERIKQLKTEKSKADKRLRQYRAVLSAQRRIPAEIWEQIFELVCCSPDKYSLWIVTSPEDYGRYTSIQSKTPPLDISRVCTRWRRVAIGRPSLWDTLSICDYGCRIPDVIHDLVKMYVARSQGRISRLRVMYWGQPWRP
ncbi:hypothetical protein PM082_000405 [Marasmius tenuissimus]|nr:hypothetical protein PM082_000405 [Marasmius tenuissimus]